MKINIRSSIIIACLLFLIQPCFAQISFSGSYTIGTGGNYPTLASAIVALKSGTVTGPVIFKLKKQVFSERITIPQINGATEINTITFTSETGNAEDAVITSAGNTFYDHHTIRFVKAKHIILDRLTISNTNKIVGSVLWMSKECEGIRINSCTLNLSETPMGAKTNSNRIGILAADSLPASAKASISDAALGKYARDLQVTNCIINNGDAGIYLVGDLSGLYAEKFFLFNNRINNTTFIGIGTKYGISDAVISGNTIDCSSIQITTGMVPVETPSQAAAVAIKSPVAGNGSNGIIIGANGYGCKIENNNITLSSSQNLNGVGIQFSGIESTISGNTIKHASSSGIEIAMRGGNIYNNMIYGFITGQHNSDIYGLAVLGSSEVNVFHNSIQMDLAPLAGNYCMAAIVNFGLGNNIFNNIFSNSVEGYAIKIDGENPINRSDRNVYYSNGTIFGNFNEKDVSNMDEWKLLTDLDSNSIFSEPQFISASDLHTLNRKLDGLGIPSFVDSDIDGDLRDPNAPDAGADEFKLTYPEVDIALKRIVYKRLKGGDNFLGVEIANLGNQAFSNKSISLSFSKNGGTSWSAPELATLNLDTSFSATIYTFKTPLNLSVSGELTICVRINEPVALDVNSSNDKICIDECLGLFDRIFTIGAGGDFLKISDAVKMLETFPCGIAGPIVFNIKSGTYNEQVNLNPIKGASEINNITFQSVSGKKEDVIITTAAGNNFFNFHTIRFLGAKYFSFKNVSIKNTANEYGVAVLFKENPSNIGLYNCFISVDTSAIDDVNSANRIAIVATDTGTTTYVHIPPVIRDGTIVSNLVIENCRIVTCDHGIYLGQGSKGFGPAGQGNCIIRNNQIIFPDLGQNKGLQYGIYADYRNNVILDGNLFDMGKGVNPSPANKHAIHFALVNKSRITNNIIKNASVSHLGLFSCNNDTVANNTIFSPIRYVGNLENIGLHISYCSDMKIWHNSILMDNTVTPNAPVSTYAVTIAHGKDNVMVNNIFSSTGGGFAASLVYTGNVLPLKISNSNDFYFPGGSFGKVNTTTIPTLAAWKTATKLDENSLNIDPTFKSKTDLHTGSASLDGKGIMTSLQVDFENDPRNQYTPDIGADEFIIANYDLGLLSFSPKSYGIGNADVTVTFINHGLLSLKGKTAKISVSLDSGKTWSTPIDYIIKGLEISNSKEETVFKELFKIKEIGVFDLCLRIEPGAIPEDIIRTNEQICNEVCVQFNPGVYRVGKLTGLEEFSSLAEVRKALTSLACELPDGLIFELSDGIYNESLLLDTNIRLKAGSELTFRSASGNASNVSIISNSDTEEQVATLIVNGANNLIFQNLTFENKGKNRGNAVQIQNGSTNISISNCRLIVDSTKKGIGITALSLLSVTGAQIVNNFISGGDYGIIVSGNNNKFSKSNSYNNNTIHAAENMGISIESDNLKELNNNKVYLRSENEFGIGIYLSEISSNAKINANYLRGASFTGIFIDQCHPDSGIVLSNNMIGGGFSIDLNGSGININASDKIYLYHNSINYDGANKLSKSLQIKSSNSVYLLNNILENSGGGYALYADGLSSLTSSDYNNIHTTGSKPIYAGSDFSFTQWQSTGKDKNSITIEPQFISSSNLHTINFALDKKGKFTSSVLFDFDNQLRDTQSPDIGADEFSIGKDIGAISVEFVDILGLNVDNSVKVKISNAGSEEVSNFNVSYSVNGNSISTEPFNGPLAVGANSDFLFKRTFKPTSIGAFKLCGKVELNNDVNAQNDQFCKDYEIVPIGIEIKDLPSFAIYPNPVNDELFIEGLGLINTIEIFDIQGKSILEMKNEKSNRISTQNLNPGIYFIRINGSAVSDNLNNSTFKKIFIKK